MTARIILFLIVCTLFNPNNIYAQKSEGGFPIEGTNTLKSAKEVPVITMPKADFKADIGRKPLCGNIFAHKFPTNINIKKQGVLTNAGDYNIWRLGIKSAHAYSLNLILEDFKVPEGARLFLYSPGKEQIKGAYTEANNTPYNFAISPIDGDEIVVDYEEPINADFKANIIIKSVNHDFKGLKSMTGYGTAGKCHLEAAHDTVHLNNKCSSVKLMIDGDNLCSGNLINNTNQDANPYIITSSHCYWITENKYVNGKLVENNYIDTNMVHTTIALFNYESPSEEWDIEGTKEMSLSGAKTIATRRTRDMILIKLNDIPPVDFRPYYAGWNREPIIFGPVYFFHHPLGDVKKFSRDESSPSTRSWDNTDFFAKNSHWRIYRWDEGWSEQGSSGGALFDAGDHIVGCLTGGNAYSSCETPGDDYFWQLCKVWNDSTYKKSLGYWLDPTGSGVYTLDGHQPYKNPCRRITHRTHNEKPSEQTQESDNTNYIVGSNAKGITEFAEKFTIDQEGTLYGVYFFPAVGYYNYKQPVYLRIYAGNDKPDSLVYEQKIRIQNKQYNVYSGEFTTEDSRVWGEKENYIRLTTPLKIDSSFFVSFTVPSGTTSPFALYYSEAKEDEQQNTAFFLNSSNEWQPFTEHPSLNAPTSLMVDVVLRDGWDNIDSLNPETPDAPSAPIEPNCPSEIEFYPTLTSGELTIGIPKGDVLNSIQVVDMSGRTLLLHDNLYRKAYYNFDVSNICMQNNVYNVIATFKYANSKTFRFIKWKTNSTK